MRNKEQTVLLVSNDAGFCAAMRKEFDASALRVRAAAVSSVAAARRILEEDSPGVILLIAADPHTAAHRTVLTSIHRNSLTIVNYLEPRYQCRVGVSFSFVILRRICCASGSMQVAGSIDGAYNSIDPAREKTSAG